MINKRTVQAAVLDLAAKLSELADDLTACVQQDSDGEDMLEALEMSAEDLEDMSAKCFTQAQEIHDTGNLKIKPNDTKFIEATKLLFQSNAIDELINASKSFKNSDGAYILDALCELGNRSLVVAYACRQALKRA